MNSDANPIEPPAPLVPRRRREHARPFDAGELGAVWSSPSRLVSLVLSAPERIAATVESGAGLGGLAGALFFAGSAFAVPYGLVHGLDAWWRIVALYVGSTLICLPSLHVFTSYLGVPLRPAQVAVLALTIPSVAALFTFGFAPILGFLRATMRAESDLVDWRSMSTALLSIALLAGVVQLGRCLVAAEKLGAQIRLYAILLVWLVVFSHVLLRMGRLLEL